MASPEEEAQQNPEETPAEAPANEAEAEAANETEAPEPAAEPTPEQALEAALEEVAKFRDAALRAEAEIQNMQRRTARDVENAHKFGIEKFLQNLLPVVDSLEKAIESAEQAAAGETENAIAEGVRLCHKLLIDVMARENVEVIDPIGEPFDPNEHQAMSMVENPDMEPNSVFAVVQKGYKLNGRLVRAAMVMVTKAPAAAAESGSDEG